MRDELMQRSTFVGMKGVEEGKGKGDGIKQQPTQQFLGLETGALFPRLHVTETSKSGPRAPPRNKMALYEQFTIPSHRFMTSSLPIPSSAQKAGSASQYAIYDKRYLYPQSSMAHSAATATRHCVGQPSLGSSTSTVVDCDELQRVPGVSQVQSSAPSVVPASSNPLHTFSTRQHKHAVGRKSRIEDDFTVPTYSAPHVSKRGTLLLSGKFALKDMQECAQDGVNCLSRPVRGIDSIHKAILPGTHDLQEATTSVNGQDKSCPEQCNTIFQQNGDVLPNAEGRDNLPVIMPEGKKWPHGNSWKDEDLLFGVDCPEDRLYYDFRNKAALPTSVPGVVSSTGSDECVTACQGNLCLDGQATLENECGRPIPESTVLESRQSHLCDSGSDDVLACLQKASPESQKFQDFQALKYHSFESSGDSEQPANGSHLQIFEPSQVAGSTGDDSDSSMVDSISIQRITPRDVIGAIGQQEFWRTRKAILRQQRIFSVQIFELHRLVKVQQLMAMSPTTEYIVSGGCSGFVPANPVGKAYRQSNVLEGGTCYGAQESRNPLFKIAADTECPSKDAISIESQAQICKGTGSQISSFAPRMSSTWGYPPYLGVGVHPWLGAMSARTGALMYQYPASFAPNPAALLGAYGPYRPVVNTSNHLDVSSVMSFGLPSYEKWSELLSESCSKYNSIPMRYPAMYYSSAAATTDPLSSWYIPRGPVLNYTERSCESKSFDEANFYSATLHCPTSVVEPVVHGANSEYGGNFRVQCQGSAFKQKPSLYGGRLNLQGQSAWKASHQKKVAAGNDLKHSFIETDRYWTRAQSEIDSFDGSVSVDEMSHVQAATAGVQAQRSPIGPKDLHPHVGPEAGLSTNDGNVESEGNSIRMRHPLPLFPVIPATKPGAKAQESLLQIAGESGRPVVKIAPRALVATPESAAGILLSIQQERRR